MDNRCAFKGCGKEPLNPSVPACDEHLCDECRMGVRNNSVSTNPTPRDLLCGRCSDADMLVRTLDAIRAEI